jgi:hypothetical protein
VLIYGVVRVAYDAFYTRLGVFPEAVGLSEATILGRAALYLAITASIGVVAGGLWLLAVGSELDHARVRTRRSPAIAGGCCSAASASRPSAARCSRPEASSVPCSARSSSCTTCLERCKFNVLNEETVDGVRKRVEGTHDRAPGQLARDFSVTVLGHAWLVVIPLVLLVVACVLGLVWARRPGDGASPMRSGVLFGLCALAGTASGFAAPLVVKLTTATADEAKKAGDAGFFDAHAELLRWLLIALPLVAVALGFLAALSLVVGAQPLRSPWVLASFVGVLPPLIGLFEPQIPLFVLERGLGAVAATSALLAALIALCFVAAPGRPGRWSPAMAVVVAVIVWSTLFLAWERGLNLGNQAAQGDQIFPKRFSLLSVRSSLVCLVPTSKDTRPSRTPFVYLGQVGSTLVLYDYLRDINVDIPEAFPIRSPAGDFDVRLAQFKAGFGGRARGCGEGERRGRDSNPPRLPVPKLRSAVRSSASSGCRGRGTARVRS